ncbi:MAG: Putative transposase (ACLAME 33), partial [Olavius algarvensis Gamma 3 endosymbiont]
CQSTTPRSSRRPALMLLSVASVILTTMLSLKRST